MKKSSNTWWLPEKKGFHLKRMLEGNRGVQGENNNLLEKKCRTIIENTTMKKSTLTK